MSKAFIVFLHDGDLLPENQVLDEAQAVLVVSVKDQKSEVLGARKALFVGDPQDPAHVRAAFEMAGELWPDAEISTWGTHAAP